MCELNKDRIAFSDGICYFDGNKLDDKEQEIVNIVISKCISIIASQDDNDLSAETAYRQICQEEIYKHFFMR